MNHAPKYVRTMKALAPLIRDVRKFSVWRFAMLCDYFAYHWNRGTISFVIDDLDQAHGVCVIKLFKDLEQFLEPFVHEPCGRFCMIEVLSADNPRAMQFMCDELSDRWGPQAVMLWDRGERTESGAPRMFKWNEFQKIARRMKDGRFRRGLSAPTS